MIKHKDEKGREGTRDKGNERRKGGRERKEKKDGRCYVSTSLLRIKPKQYISQDISHSPETES